MKYTKDIIDRVIENIKIGLNQDDAAEEAGVNPDTFYQWKKNKPEFAEKLRQAHLSRKKRNLAIITKAAITKWQAAAWDLERRYRQEFASWYKVEHSGPGGGPIPSVNLSASVDFDKMNEKKIEQLVQRLDAILRPQSKRDQPESD